MIRTCNDGNVCTRYYRTPRCAGLCLPVPPSAYKIPNQSLEKYSGVLAPTSSMLFLARQMPYRTSHVLSIVELFTQSESGVPVGYRSCQVLPRAFIGWQCLQHNSIWTVKELAFADYVSVYSRPARLYIVIIRLIAATVPWGLEPHDAMHHRVHACGVEPLTNHSAYNTSSMPQLTKFNDVGKSIKFHFGWSNRSRTYIPGTKNPCLTFRRYSNLVGVAGFAPAPPESQNIWFSYPKTLAAPVTPHLDMVGVAGFEPATYRSQSGRATNCAILRYGGDKRNRTFDTRIFNPLLYRLSYVSKYGTR